MSNHLSAAEKAAILASFAEGHGINATARRLKHSTAKVRLLFPRDNPPLCGCGRPVGHRGWCHVRIERSSERQAYLANAGKGKKMENTRKTPGLAETAKLLEQLGAVVAQYAQCNAELQRASQNVQEALGKFDPETAAALALLIASDHTPGMSPAPEMPAGGGLTPVAPVETPIPPQAPEPKPAADPPPPAVPAAQPETAEEDVHLSVPEYAAMHEMSGLIVAKAVRLGWIPATAAPKSGAGDRTLINVRLADRHLVRNGDGQAIGFAGNVGLPTHAERRALAENVELLEISKHRPKLAAAAPNGSATARP